MRVALGQAGLFGLIVFMTVVPSASRADDAPATPEPGAKPAVRASQGGRASTEARSPGFETLADGSTRLSIELSQPVTYDTKTASGRVTYVLKGARVARRNDYNPLVTVNFNTPVTSARLVPHGRDLWFVVELRAPVKPDVKTDAAKEGGTVLQIEFPKGDYVVAAPDPQPADSSAPEGDPAADSSSGPDSTSKAASAPKRRHGSR